MRTLPAWRTEAETDLEFKRMFSGEMDGNNCYVDQSGSGGYWSTGLGRDVAADDICAGVNHMVLKPKSWNYQRRGVAGLRAHRFVKGDYAFGWLRTEIGVHRLVKITVW